MDSGFLQMKHNFKISYIQMQWISVKSLHHPESSLSWKKITIWLFFITKFVFCLHQSFCNITVELSLRLSLDAKHVLPINIDDRNSAISKLYSSVCILVMINNIDILSTSLVFSLLLSDTARTDSCRGLA